MKADNDINKISHKNIFYSIHNFHWLIHNFFALAILFIAILDITTPNTTKK